MMIKKILLINLIFFSQTAQTIANDIKYDGNKNYSYYLNKHIRYLNFRILMRKL